MKWRLTGILMLSMLFVAGAVFADDAPLPSPKDTGKVAAAYNNEGISHYRQGHWNVAIKHFQEAVEADSKFAIAHYNLALAMHKAGNHGKASKHFKIASDLAPKNKEIQGSKVLIEHIK